MNEIILIDPLHLGHNRGSTWYIFWINLAQFLRNSLDETSDLISAATASSVKTPTLYKYVRHPMTIGVLNFFWATPTMTAGHFLFAAGMTIYTVIGLKLEEHDLVKQYGENYIAYKQEVGMFLPLQKWPTDWV